MEVAERHEVTLKKPRQEAEVNPISELGVKIIDFQIDLEIQYCQARVQVPNPLSQQAPNPDSKVRPSLKNPKTQFFGLSWHNNHMGHPPHPITLSMKECSGKKVQKIKVAQNDPLDSPAKKIEQMYSENKDMGCSYMFEKKFINQP